MKIKSLQLSNILNYEHYDDIEKAPIINFEDGINIIIGQNGAGKSTMLEVINLIFKRILLVPFVFDKNTYSNRLHMQAQDQRRIINSYNGYMGANIAGLRLNANWNTENKPRKIRIKVLVDNIDKANILILKNNKEQLVETLRKYTQYNDLVTEFPTEEVLLDLHINPNTPDVNFIDDTANSTLQYLRLYNMYKMVIELYNSENKNVNNHLPTFFESFSLIGGYRNYNAFNSSVALNIDANEQIQNLRISSTDRSTNTLESSEPFVFNLVRLRVASMHQDLVFTNLSESDVEEHVNNGELMNVINDKLKLIKLQVKIKLANKYNWSYSFVFYDSLRKRELGDINALSAGQKAIIHLIFESYGHGELKGGIIIIDEPELHLHYQFQHEYLKIIEDLNESNNCQYILVTHSEALISSKTIDKVRRFTLDKNNFTKVFSPILKPDDKILVKILDNNRSTYAFFSKKVILVEGDTDRYFFTALLRVLHPELNQDIAIIDMGGKSNFEKWNSFFESFGLTVYFIGDIDNIFNLKYQTAPLVSKETRNRHENQLKQQILNNLDVSQKKNLADHYKVLISDSDFLSDPKRGPWKSFIDYFLSIVKIKEIDIVQSVRIEDTNLDLKIDHLATNKIFILKQGVLEDYLDISNKDLNSLIPFCEDLTTWITKQDSYVTEVLDIIKKIVA
jgi:predicted ATP-dependent endonuclease of OLD family